MDATFRFDCSTIEGMSAFRDALDGRQWRGCMKDLVSYMDNILDNSDEYSSDEIEIIQMIRDQTFEIIRDENLLLWD